MSARAAVATILLAVAAASLGVPASARAASPGQAAADRGAERYRAGDLEGARAAFREAVRLDPGHENAWHSLGWVEHRLGNDDEARRIWNRLLTLDPERADTRRALAALRREAPRPRAAGGPEPDELFRQAEAALGVGDAAGAERALAAALALPGLDARRIARAADLLARYGEVDRGVALLEGPGVPADAAGRSQGLARLLAARGATAYAAGRVDAAIEAFERAAALDGGSRAALGGLAAALRKAGRSSEAEAAWRRYALAFPAVAEPHDQLAAIYLERGAFQLALEESRASLAIDPDSKLAQVRAVRSLVGLTRYVEAREVAATLAARHPDDPHAQRLYADALTKTREHREAARQWRRVLDLEPGNVAAKVGWVRALHESGDADAALAAARAIAASPDAPPEVVQLLAEDARARGDLGDAARWYRELVRRRPDRVEAWRILLQTLDALGRFQEQVAVAREAVRRLPRRAELEVDLATALGNVGALREAIAHTRAYLAAFPDNRAAYEALVDLLGRTGDTAGALALLSRNHPAFYKDYEQTMIEASLRSKRGDLAGAARLLRGIAEAGPEHHFVPILLYHGVVPHDRTLQISQRAFEEQMAALASRGYRTITLSQLARMIDGEEPFPERPILITFDDGRTDSLELADPVLARHGFVATMFVPTAQVGVEDAFHAGWDTLLRHAATGRWDLQAHGHEAHTPMVISADGDRGEFLAYRRWLPARGGPETVEEFLARIDRDYRTCRDELAQHSGRPPIGFAYPLNQVAYAQREDGARLAGVNERAAARYYRFGMVQDESGYNHLRAGEPPPFMLRRFEVPGTWSGEALLVHLARNDPGTAARLELAQLALDDGRPHAARRMLERLVAREPLVAADVEAALARVAWQEQRPREAAAHLAASARTTPAVRPQSDTLPDRLAWANRLDGGVATEAFADSDGRTVASAGTTLRRPLVDQLDVELGGGALRIAERRVTALSGAQLRLGVSGAVGHDLALSSWARVRQLSGLAPRLNGGLSVRGRAEQHALSLRWVHEDVETVPAERAGIGRDELGAAWELEAPRWIAEASVAWFAFGDGNQRTDGHATVLRLLGAEGRWGVGATVDVEDSRFVAPEYWSPDGLASATARARYRREWPDSSAVSVAVGLGAARDATHGTRPTGAAVLGLSRAWGPRRALSTGLSLEGRAIPGYRSLAGSFLLAARF